MRRNGKRLPGLLLGALDGGTSGCLERRVMRLIEAPAVWARRWRVASAVGCAVVLGVVCLSGTVFGVKAAGQNDMPEWQRAAGVSMKFEVTSIKENKDDDGKGNKMKTNFPWGSTPLYNENGGYMRAHNAKLVDMIGFAYYMTGMEGYRAVMPQLPDWAKEMRFDIEAKSAEGKEPTKDQMRLMMQTLLADRFGLKAHTEAKETSAYVMSLVDPGKPGPDLKPHPESYVCDFHVGTKSDGGSGIVLPLADDGLPPECGNVRGSGKNPEVKDYAARRTEIEEIAKMLTVWINDERPVLDETGLKGYYDWKLAFVPENPTNAPVGKIPQWGVYGPGLVQALKKQLGIKVTLTKAPVETLMIDHIERATGN